MATIDDRVVAMSFENSKFEQNVSKSLGTLDKLKQSLNFTGAGKGLDQIENRASRLDMSGVSRSLDSLNSKFSGLGLAATAAFATVVSRAASAGIQMTKSLTLDPIIAGFHNYETQINAVQTIMANTGLSGKKGIGQINSTLADLNNYANRTIYNFSEMARNIGTFTAAGVDLKTATGSIKGIANLAAMSGSTAEQASTAMYQLSQAIAAGKVNLQDWNSVVNAGMGGKVFQQALANTAQAMGTLKDGSVQLVGPMKQLTINGQSFRQALQTKPGQKSWLTSEVLTKTLQQFTGDLKNSQLAAMGFSQAQIKAIQAQAKTAVNAATQIKTLTQMMQALKEEVASAWSGVFKTIFGNIDQSRSLFTSLHNTLQNALTAPINNLNKMLQEWAKFGGRKDLFAGLKAAGQDLSAVFKPIKEAFREIFPATTGKQLADATKRFRNLMESLKIGPQTANELKRTFAGFFAALDIGKRIVGGILSVIAHLFGIVGKGSGGFLALTGSIGDWIVALDKALKSGHGLSTFFSGLSSVLAVPIRLFTAIKRAIFNLFTGLDPKAPDALKNAFENIKNGLGPLSKASNAAQKVWEKFLSLFEKVKEKVKNAVGDISDAFSNFGQTLAQAFHSTNFSNVLRVINTGLLGGILLLVKRFFSKGLSIDIGHGLLGNISGVFEALTGHLKTMQQSVKADILLKIAAALGILSLAIVGLSMIDPKSMNRSMSALAILFGELLGAMTILGKVNGIMGALSIPAITAGLLLLAGAIDLLVLAMVGLSKLNWEQLAKGLIGVGGLLGEITLAAGPLSASAPGMIRAGIGISAIGVAMNILAPAVKQFGNLNWGQLGKGLLGLGGALVIVASSVKIFPIGLPAIGAGLILVGMGINSLARAVTAFGQLNLKVIGTGLLGIGGALVTIFEAMRLVPPGLVAQAAGLVLVSIALKGIAKAIDDMGGLALSKIAKGLLGFGGALTVLALGLDAMSGAIAGATALLIAAGAMRILVPALKSLSDMKIGDLVKSLLAMGAAFAVLGAAGMLLAPISPALLAMGVALLAIGGGLALAGAGILAISAALSILVASGPAGIAILIGALTKFVAAIPAFVTGFVNGLLTMVQKIAEYAPQFALAMGKIIMAISAAIVTAMPGLVKAFGAIVQGLLQAINNNLPQIIQTGLKMLLALLKGISDNIGQVVNQAANILIHFLNALANKMPQIMTAGANLLIKFLQGIINNLTRVVGAVATLIAKFINEIGSQKNVDKVLGAGANFVIHFINGLGKKIPDLIQAGVNLLGKVIDGIGKGTTTLAKKLINAIFNFVWNVGWLIKTNGKRAVDAAWQLGKDIIEGLKRGIEEATNKIFNDSPAGVFIKLFNGFQQTSAKKLKARSPSLVYAEFGKNIVEGLAMGIEQNGNRAVDSMKSTMDQLIDTAKKGSKAVGGAIRIAPNLVPVKEAEAAHKKTLESIQKLQDRGFYGPTGSLIMPTTGIKIAKDISTVQPTTPSEAKPDQYASGGGMVSFQQNIYSPESLSEQEIYRHTHNQLSQARAALKM